MGKSKDLSDQIGENIGREKRENGKREEKRGEEMGR
jgi:hypothetical protein